MDILSSLRRVWAEGEVQGGDPSQAVKADDAPLKPSNSGFLLLDASLQPIYANQDAANILLYPTIPTQSRALIQAMRKRLETLLEGHLPALGTPSVVEFMSGRRRYVMRAFCLDSRVKTPLQPAYALLMERGHHVLMELASVSSQYNLTNRELETMRLLLDGLTSKEIASRMKI